MNIQVIPLPSMLKPDQVSDRIVVVFDVLRATTTMTSALAVGVSEIRIYESIDEARSVKAQFPNGLLAGEQMCLKPEGFDLGNSPGGFNDTQHAGRSVLMATTNGTRAIVAARNAHQLLIGALVNANSVAQRILSCGLDCTLLCAGTNGEVAMEDLLGAGAVIEHLHQMCEIRRQTDFTCIAHRLFQAEQADLLTPLTDSAGGRNVIAAGLSTDVLFASRLDTFDAVGVVRDSPLRVVAWK